MGLINGEKDELVANLSVDEVEEFKEATIHRLNKLLDEMNAKITHLKDQFSIEQKEIEEEAARNIEKVDKNRQLALKQIENEYSDKIQRNISLVEKLGGNVDESVMLRLREVVSSLD